MASITEKGLSGRVGPVVYYEMNGKQYARARPVHKKKRARANTHPAASLFGKCSKAASYAGHMLQSNLDCSFKLKSFNLLRGWLFKQYKLYQEQEQWVLGVDFIPPCQLNPVADLRDFLFLPIHFNTKKAGTVEVSVPSFDPVKQIHNPLRAASANISIIVMGLPLGEAKTGSFIEIQRIPVDFKEGMITNKTLLFKNKQIQPGTVLMVTVAVTYYTQQQQAIKEDAYLPAAVIGLGKV